MADSRPISRRRFLTGALGAASAAGLLSACNIENQRDDDIAPRGTEPTGHLLVATYGDSTTKPAYEKIYDSFRVKYPRVDLETRYIPAASWAEFFDSLAIQMAGGKGPDVLRIAVEGARIFISRRLLLPLDDYIDRDRAELADFFADTNPKLVDMVKNVISPDGKMYYLPGGFNPMCMWCNTELFAKAGLDEPDDGWTWSDFRHAAEKIGELPNTFGAKVDPAYFGGILPWSLTNGSNVMNPDWTVPTFDSPANVEAVGFMRSLIEAGVCPKPGGVFNTAGELANNRLGMYGSTRGALVQLRALDAIGKVKIVAWPRKKRQGSPIGVLGFPILRTSRNREAAWAFVKTMASREASMVIARDSPIFVPPRRSAVRSPEYRANSPRGVDALYRTLDYGTVLPSPSIESLLEQRVIDSLNQILTGNIAVRQGLHKLNNSVRSDLRA